LLQVLLNIRPEVAPEKEENGGEKKIRITTFTIILIREDLVAFLSGPTAWKDKIVKEVRGRERLRAWEKSVK